MIKQFFALVLTIVLPAVAVAADCVLLGAANVTPNTPWAAGPNVYAAVVANPAIANAISAGRDAWDSTDAINRVGDWNGSVTGNDCPAGQPSQLGAFDFHSPCSTLAPYGINPDYTLAFVDYFPSFCSQCGTRSISVNLTFFWSTNPLPGEYDIQGVLAHEFGHVLGLAHMQNGVCTDGGDSPSCSANPGRETMGFRTYEGETCMRDLAPNDINSANSFYP